MSTTLRVDTDFNFRTKDGLKRATVTVSHELPSTEGILEMLAGEDPKVVDLITSTIQSLVVSHLRGYVDADLEFDQAKCDALAAEGKLTIQAIANLPKSERSMLTKEDLEAFAKDYIAIMPGVTGKSVEKVSAAAGLFVERYKRVAGDNSVLAVLQDQLSVFVENAGEEALTKHEKALSYLIAKVEELLSVKVTADAL